MNKNNFKLSIFNKIKFFLKKPYLVIIEDYNKELTKEIILALLKTKSKKEKEFLVLDNNLEKIESLNFLIKNSSLPVLIINYFKEFSSEKDDFSLEKEKIKIMEKITKKNKNNKWLILNFDNEKLKEIKDTSHLKSLTFGFEKEADVFVSDIKSNGGTNFKINYKGNIVPFWLEGVFNKEQIYSVLAATCVGIIFDLNLVEISQNLKNYKSSFNKKNQ